MKIFLAIVFLLGFTGIANAEFSPTEETALKRVVRRARLVRQLKTLNIERNSLYSVKDTEMETKRLEAEQLVNDTHMPGIDLKDAEIQEKSDEIDTLDTIDNSD